ncbi:methyltransferase domain-containing protein [Microbacterium sp. ET2]|uniref:class I SAM-dependent methyltransferase n=1 Tax=Microbacterium albipurpureum TaxID=3050384 RepID=UPI00259CBE49|nr:methyltransferase domain-containing protein [Microbacterium sp. ET2 (Ac-2212)]WJL96410.1 methyltransferase domain-containing protein [Microbacterium sp. ET2 (Ac-2212)]
MTHDDGWSALAEGWAARWGGVSAPARQALIAACAIGPEMRVLDVGCGSGEFLAELGAVGARAIGVDSSPAMVAIAARRGDAREADAAALPFADAWFDVVTAVTVLHLTDDLDAAVRECARVLRAGGLLGVAEWSRTGRNDLAVVERALEVALDPDTRGSDSEVDATSDGAEPPHPSALDLVLDAAGFRRVSHGEVQVGVRAADADQLAATVLLGEDEATIHALSAAIETAAEPFQKPDGGYELRNTFRWRVVSRT